MEVIYNGKTYTSINSLWKDTGVGKAKLREGINNGIPVEDIVANHKKLAFEFKGVRYRSITDFIRRNELSESRFRYIYTKCNGDIEEALKQYNNYIEYNGVKYSSNRELCNTLGIDEHSWSKARKKFDSIDDAVAYLLENKRKTHQRAVSYDGVEYSNIRELCETLELDYNAFIIKKYELGTDNIADVVNAVREINKHEIVVAGQVFKNQKEMCEQYGVPYYTYMGRRKLGATVEEALMPHKRLHEFKGKKYTLTALALEYNVSYYALRRRIKNHDMSVEEAMNDWLKSKANK